MQGVCADARVENGRKEATKEQKSKAPKEQKSQATLPTLQAAAAGGHLIYYPLDPQNALLLTRRQVAALHVRISRLLFLVFAAGA